MGTRFSASKALGSMWDHPHAYGDKVFDKTSHQHTPGSSPRVWGQGKSKKGRIYQRRIIPTRMGTRKLLARKSRNHGDHPHAYGDKFCRSFMSKPRVGSSPRVWGQANYKHRGLFVYGIIPTRMGTSLNLRLRITAAKDHPHAYGDKT
mgnify:CR=1 FL=1